MQKGLQVGRRETGVRAHSWGRYSNGRAGRKTVAMGGRQRRRLFRRLNPQGLVTACRGRGQSQRGVPLSHFVRVSESPAPFTVPVYVPGHPSAFPFESTPHHWGSQIEPVILWLCIVQCWPPSKTASNPVPVFL